MEACELVTVDVVCRAEEGDVGVVTPAGVDRPALNRRDDLLGIHHGKRVPTHGDGSPEKAGYLDLSWRGHDGVANVDVNVERDARATGDR